MSTENKAYILQKDLPQTEMLTSYYLNGDHYYPHRKPSGEMFALSDGRGFSVHKCWVENNPEWFLPEEKVDGIPSGAKDLEVFHIKGKEAFIGFKIANGNFHFISVPYNQKPENKSNDSPPVIHSVQRKDGKIIAIGDDEYKQGEVKSMHTEGEILATTKKGIWNINELEDEQAQAENREPTYRISPTANKIFEDTLKEMYPEQTKKFAPQAENKPDRDWEILKVYREETGNYRVREDFQNGFDDYVLKDIKTLDIISVKRLSDGITFSAREWTALPNKMEAQIQSFKIENDTIVVTIVRLDGEQKDILLSQIKKLPPQPQKLFTTEDGVDIFSGDWYWFIGQISETPLSNMAHEAIAFPSNSKRFSTKEAAEKYIAENKPKYNANFLWGFSNDTIEAIGYEFANAKTEEYQKECWNELVKKIKENPTAPQPQKEEQGGTVKVGDRFRSGTHVKPQEQPPQRCGICGGGLVLIRGRYPNMDKREVCPTCTTERLEQIQEISSSHYGQASQNSKQ